MLWYSPERLRRTLPAATSDGQCADEALLVGGGGGGGGNDDESSIGNATHYSVRTTTSAAAPTPADSVLSPGEDIYALGIIMAEIANRKAPYRPANGVDSSTTLANEALLREIAHSSSGRLVRPRLPRDGADRTPAPMDQLIEQCLSEECAARPTTSSLRKAIEEFLRWV